MEGNARGRGVKEKEKPKKAMGKKSRTSAKLDSANKNNRFGCSMRHFSVCHPWQRKKVFLSAGGVATPCS